MDYKRLRQRGKIEVDAQFVFSGGVPDLLADLRLTPLFTEHDYMRGVFIYGGISPLFKEISEGDEPLTYTPQMDRKKLVWVIE